MHPVIQLLVGVGSTIGETASFDTNTQDPSQYLNKMAIVKSNFGSNKFQVGTIVMITSWDTNAGRVQLTIPNTKINHTLSIYDLNGYLIGMPSSKEDMLKIAEVAKESIVTLEKLAAYMEEKDEPLTTDLITRMEAETLYESIKSGTEDISTEDILKFLRKNIGS